MVRIAGSGHIKELLSREYRDLTSFTPTTIRRLFGENSLVVSQGEAHRYKRRAISKAFNHESLENYTEHLNRIVQIHLETWCQKGKVKVFQDVEKITFKAACEVLIGIDADDHKLQQLSLWFNDYLGGFFTLPINIQGTSFNKVSSNI